MAEKKFVFVVSLIAIVTLNGVVDASTLCRVWYLECCCETPVNQPALPVVPREVYDYVPVTVPRLLPIPEESKEVIDASVETKSQHSAKFTERVGSLPYTGNRYQRFSQIKMNSVSIGYPQPVANAQAAGYTSYIGQGTYKVHKVGTTWYDAMRVCASEGATLAVISSSAEADLIKTLFRPNELFPNAVNNMHFWVGVQERGVDRQFWTVFGQRLEESGYHVWSTLAGGQPNDRGTTDCVSIFIEGGYFDDECNSRYAFVCKLIA